MDSPMPHPPPYPADDEAVTLVSAPTETLRAHLEAIRGKTWLLGVEESDQPEVVQLAVAALAILDNSQPQCLDDPPGCSHQLVPDREVKS